MEARGADERDGTIYDPVSRDCLARVGGGGGTRLLALQPQRKTVYDRGDLGNPLVRLGKDSSPTECSEQQLISILPLTGCKAGGGGCN